MAGNEAAARQTAASLAADLGWTDVFDLGDLTAARGLEMYLPLWVRLFALIGSAEFNIKVVRSLIAPSNGSLRALRCRWKAAVSSNPTERHLGNLPLFDSFVGVSAVGGASIAGAICFLAADLRRHRSATKSMSPRSS